MLVCTVKLYYNMLLGIRTSALVTAAQNTAHFQKTRVFLHLSCSNQIQPHFHQSCIILYTNTQYISKPICTDIYVPLNIAIISIIAHSISNIQEPDIHRRRQQQGEKRSFSYCLSISFGSSEPSDIKFVEGSTSGVTLARYTTYCISWIEIHKSYKTSEESERIHFRQIGVD